jgi:hypothetical protein
MGITAGSANVTFAEECRPLGSVMFRQSAHSRYVNPPYHNTERSSLLIRALPSSRYYFCGDNTIIRWKLAAAEWQVRRAYLTQLHHHRTHILTPSHSGNNKLSPARLLLTCPTPDAYRPPFGEYLLRPPRRRPHRPHARAPHPAHGALRRGLQVVQLQQQRAAGGASGESGVVRWTC